MSLRDTLIGLISQERQHMVHVVLNADRVTPPFTTTVAAAGAHYFRVALAQMFIRKKSQILQTWYPAVNSLVTCSFAGKPTAVELPNVADSSRLVANQDGNGDVVAKNFTLLPLLPFKGGEVKILAGLFAVKGSNPLQGYLGVMSDFAKLLAVPQLSAALSVADPLAKGIQTLFGGGGGMQLGYYDTFQGAGAAPPVLQDQYVAIVRATSDEVRPERLYVKDSLLCEGSALASAQPLTGYDYMLLRIEVRSERDDWNQLADIAGPFQRAKEALSEGDTAKAETEARQALRAAYTAPELTDVDHRRVVELIKAEYTKAKADLDFKGLVPREEADLQQLVANRAMTVEKAVALGLPTWEDLQL